MILLCIAVHWPLLNDLPLSDIYLLMGWWHSDYRRNFLIFLAWEGSYGDCYGHGNLRYCSFQRFFQPFLPYLTSELQQKQHFYSSARRCPIFLITWAFSRPTLQRYCLTLERLDNLHIVRFFPLLFMGIITNLSTTIHSVHSYKRCNNSCLQTFINIHEYKQNGVFVQLQLSTQNTQSLH